MQALIASDETQYHQGCLWLYFSMALCYLPVAPYPGQAPTILQAITCLAGLSG